MSSVTRSARADAATFVLGVAVMAGILLAAPLLVLCAAAMLVVPSTRSVLRRLVAAVVELEREAVTVAALGVLWVVSPLLGGRGAERSVRAHTHVLGWFVRSVLRGRAVLLDAPLVTESIPDDLVLDHRPPGERRPLLVLAVAGGEADALVLCHTAVNIHRRRMLSVPRQLILGQVPGRSALRSTLSRLSRPDDAADVDVGGDGAVVVLGSPEAGAVTADGLAGDADVLVVAHRGWPGELRMAHWSMQREELPVDVDDRAERFSAMLRAAQRWSATEEP